MWSHKFIIRGQPPCFIEQSSKKSCITRNTIFNRMKFTSQLLIYIYLLSNISNSTLVCWLAFALALRTQCHVCVSPAATWGWLCRVEFCLFGHHPPSSSTCHLDIMLPHGSLVANVGGGCHLHTYRPWTWYSFKIVLCLPCVDLWETFNIMVPRYSNWLL